MRKVVTLVSLLFAALPFGALAQSATPIATVDPAAYCVEKGGTVVHRTPALGTNNPDSMLVLGGGADFCQFADGPEGDMSTSRISIDVESFAATEPTMAVLAYLTTPPLPPSTSSANPASLYCAHLGGMELGATTMRGGGWITDARGNDLDVLEVCTFPDGSMIDSWGITYHTDGTIRGADLKPLLGYQTNHPPMVFPQS
jgi:putative hemolysin